MTSNNDLMRQMQQQLAAQGAIPQQQGGSGNFINANVLMNAFQQTANPGQNPLQGAESLLASVLAAANSNAQNQSGVQGGQPQPAPAGGPASGPFPGLQGFDQFQGLNATGFPQGLQPSINGLQGLQQQLMSLQQQFGGGVSQQQTQQNVHGQDQGGQQQMQFAQQQQFPWMGQIGQGFNPAVFNPAALSLGGLGGADPNAFQGQDAFAGQNGMANLGMAGVNQGTFPFQQQQFQQQVPQQQSNGSKQSGRGASLSGGGKNGNDEPASGRGANGKSGKKAALDKKKRAKSFPEKLMQGIMDYADEEAVAWLPDGKSFVIVNPDLFCDEVLNKIFKESKYASFVRKLHRYVNCCCILQTRSILRF